MFFFQDTLRRHLPTDGFGRIRLGPVRSHRQGTAQIRQLGGGTGTNPYQSRVARLAPFVPSTGRDEFRFRSWRLGRRTIARTSIAAKSTPPRGWVVGMEDYF